MQRKSCAAALIACAAGLFSFASTAHADPVVFGNFEGSQSDGFGYFTGSGVGNFSGNPSVTYGYSSTGATNGSTSLSITAAGYQQSDLAYDFKANGHVADFFANDILSFDMTFPTSASSTGYAQIYQLVLNGQGGGYTQQGAAPLDNQSPPYNGQVNHVSVNYDAFKANMAANPSYLQLIITTNNGGGAPSTVYLDNFALSAVPEPASLGILGAAAVGLLGRRRRR